MSHNRLTIHREEYVYLAGLTHNSALIAWGAFLFKVKGDLENGKWKLLDDSDLEDVESSRANLIGASSKPYADEGTAAEVTITDQRGESRTESFVGANHALFEGLASDTVYSYSVKINGHEWGGGVLRDWVIEGGEGAMRPGGKAYKKEFRTFPDPAKDALALAFIVLGDFGRGVQQASKGEMCQREIAEAVMAAVEAEDVRLIITTGDNIYHGSKQGNGDEDDDWFFTFFQPYRYVISRIPCFPCVGNHDDGETFGESSDDRRQLYDNLYIRNRFVSRIPTGEASIEPGLFYRFRFGSNIEFVCIDTSKQTWLFGERYFKHPNHQAFLEQSFPAGAQDARLWRIPYFHHPPFCAGPNHSNKDSLIEHLTPKFIRSGVHVVFNGHEHNMQHSLDQGVSYFITGGAGKFSASAPTRLEEAKTQAWGGNDEGHFILARIDAHTMTVMPLGKRDNSGNLRPIKMTFLTAGNELPFRVEL